MDIDKAEEFAIEKHKGQLDDNGESYYASHLRKVAIAVATFTNDKEIIIAALLHDTIEDCEDVDYELIKKEFGKRVADLVNEVTQEGQKDNYGYYFPRLKTADGILIKLCDRASNISRMESWPEKRKEQYKNKTKFWKDKPKNG